ncbi:MAG TPA: GNAT family N-acetyltransferase [Actinomycetota bacterium]|nr:GNAT family N-acetyltransferase [Actinomycetota bacterium]
MPDLRPSPLDSIRRIGARARARGLREAWSAPAARVKDGIRSQGVLVFLVRDLDGRVAPPVPEHLAVRRATATDADVYARQIGTDSPTTFRRRLSATTGCWLLLERNRILHATWTTTGPAWVGEIRRFFRPPPGDIYIYESFTQPDARGRGAYPLILGHVCGDAAAAGLTRAWIGVEKHNVPSVRAITKAGFEPGFEIEFGRRWGRLLLGEPHGARADDCRDCLAPRSGGAGAIQRGKP